jgi:hypothetical protein
MFIPLVVTSLHDFPGMGFILFLCSIGEQANIVMHIEIKKRSRLAARFVNDEIVKCIVLKRNG